jgi:hypothetical protein
VLSGGRFALDARGSIPARSRSARVFRTNLFVPDIISLSLFLFARRAPEKCEGVHWLRPLHFTVRLFFGIIRTIRLRSLFCDSGLQLHLSNASTVTT